MLNVIPYEPMQEKMSVLIQCIKKRSDAVANVGLTFAVVCPSDVIANVGLTFAVVCPSDGGERDERSERVAESGDGEERPTGTDGREERHLRRSVTPPPPTPTLHGAPIHTHQSPFSPAFSHGLSLYPVYIRVFST